VFAYDFANNEVPGTHSYEESAYWRDVGTIDAYHAANMDTLGVKPRFNLYNPLWTINSSVFQGRASHIVDGHICNSSFGAGTIVQGATIRNSIIRAGVLIEPDVVIEDSIIMDHTVICRGARLRRTIVDRDNEIERDASIGYHSASRQSGTHVTDSGITVISKGSCQSSVHCY
jgi:glucose-1-phosphate adenylyltransferase